MLAQVALIVFALCAVLSLIIDIGYARLTQAQMQNAVDAAAIEGLRPSNIAVPDPCTGQIADNASARQRMAARCHVSRVFDDDLDPTNGDPDQFGAGPIIDLTGGATRLHAHQTMSVPDPHVYKPVLELNQDDAIQGDMVRGTFTSSSDPAPPEDQGYNRTDFTPNATGTAFLVRLRRSNEGSEQDVASSGPSLPLTFGKGTLIGGDDPSSTYSPRRDGLTVRATAIAATRPALRVGLPQLQATPPLPGVTSLALASAFVQTLNSAGTQVNCGAPGPPAGCVTIDPTNGRICSGLTCGAVTPATAVIGRFVTNPANPAAAPRLAISRVGQAFAPVPPVPPAPQVTVTCASANFVSQYGPVYSAIVGAGTRIVGFTLVSLGQDPSRAAIPCAKRVVRNASAIAASNATASLGGLTPAQVAAVLTVPNVLNPPTNQGLLLAPVLAR